MSSAKRPLGPPGQAALWTIFRCHDRVLAVPVDAVERLVQAEEVRMPDADRSAPLAPGAVISLDERSYSAWDLGQMLRLEPAASAWLLLRIDAGDAPLRLALRTGPCLAVRPIPAPLPLPPALFRERYLAFSAAFHAADVVADAAPGSVGLCLDPVRLWTAAELESARAALVGIEPVRRSA